MAPQPGTIDRALEHHRAGRFREAETLYREILDDDADNAEARHFLGVVAYQTGRLESALADISGAIEMDGNVAKYHANLGAVFLGLGRHDEAVAALERSIGLDPKAAEAHNTLGLALTAMGQLEGAVASYRAAADFEPGFAEALGNLAVALHNQGEQGPALDAARNAVDADPSRAESHNNLAIVLFAAGKDGEAVAALGRALELNPAFAESHRNLGLHHQRRNALAEAKQCYTKAIDSAPDDARSHNNMGGALLAEGHVEKAIESFRTAIAIKPDFAAAHSNLLMALNHSAEADANALTAEARRWDEVHAPILAPLVRSHQNARDPDRPLKIGYVAPDLRRHPLRFFLAPILAVHDREAFHVTCYSDSTKSGQAAANLEPHTDAWRETSHLGDEALAETVRADAIDILVDLYGHTARNRLRALAIKPAPVQVSWAGYPGTTGLVAMDGLFGDEILTPEDEDGLYTEQVIRLPDAHVCYAPPSYAPEVSSLPAAASGAISFGSFSRPAKLGPGPIGLWARILECVPGSRLVLRNFAFDDAATRARYHAMFEQSGIAPDRIAFERGVPHTDLLAAYGEIDIALDPFPYSGGITTIEALWMGVPVIALRGDRVAGRRAASLLGTAGLDQLIAANADDYVDRAVSLAGDSGRLAELRAALRDRVTESPLCDGQHFTRAWESGLRARWRRWCGA